MIGHQCRESRCQWWLMEGNPARLKLASENFSCCRQPKCAASAAPVVLIGLFSDIEFSTADKYLTQNCVLQEDAKHGLSFSFAFVIVLFYPCDVDFK